MRLEETDATINLEHFGFDIDEQNLRITLGRGMAGFTYRGWVQITKNRGDGTECVSIPAALKEVKAVTDGPGYSLKREVMLLGTVGQLGHPGLVKFLRFFFNKLTPIIATELVHGETLSAIVRRSVNERGTGTPEWIRKVLAWGLNLTSALDRLKSAGVLHRDIKPANVIIREEDGLPVLIDFGIGKSEVNLDPDGTTSVSRDRFVGTPIFASPEQFCPGPETCEACHIRRCKLSSKSDIYSLGVTLWYCLTGKHLFDQESRRFRDITELLRLKRLGVTSAALRETAPHLLPGVTDLLAPLLQGDPALRPTPSEFRRDLVEFLEEALQVPVEAAALPDEVVTEVGVPLEPLPRFVQLRGGLEIAATLLPVYAVNFWSSREEDRIDFDENAAAPCRLSFDLAREIIDALNQDESLREEPWSYRLPTSDEWIQAAGFLPDGVRGIVGSRPRRILNDVGREHEWCEDSQRSTSPDCRKVQFLSFEAPILCERHRLWPKGALRLVRQNRAGEKMAK